MTLPSALSETACDSGRLILRLQRRKGRLTVPYEGEVVEVEQVMQGSA